MFSGFSSRKFHYSVLLYIHEVPQSVALTTPQCRPQSSSKLWAMLKPLLQQLQTQHLHTAFSFTAPVSRLKLLLCPSCSFRGPMTKDSSSSSYTGILETHGILSLKPLCMTSLGHCLLTGLKHVESGDVFLLLSLPSGAPRSHCHTLWEYYKCLFEHASNKRHNQIIKLNAFPSQRSTFFSLFRSSWVLAQQIFF